MRCSCTDAVALDDAGGEHARKVSPQVPRLPQPRTHRYCVICRLPSASYLAFVLVCSICVRFLVYLEHFILRESFPCSPSLTCTALICIPCIASHSSITTVHVFVF
ncbi:uncharacterized protein C8Q71DRAFT_814335 [Rhodofomes roseus]|uniref:Uncharacterized protein n=1 Tax=Rhodofomes roseus TaxID=34475 RepID=A0ABQ8K7J5_9APHY|nr:uncharacterized protein C8Q71DRAFT_814335 [Rhodofomes roseus]KAH9833225.1 hypothetical protein C8Q71DRAFT_814335 [Rhodofomes roseus]